ncbi:MAG: AzlD domain-containing protein [Nitriliruptoraceae bacterium]
MTPTVVALVLLAVGTYVLKATGPLVAAGRELAPWLDRLANLLPAGLLAALVATQTVASGTALVADARLVGLAAAAVAVVLRAHFGIVVLVGAAATAGVRALGWA